MDKLCIFCVLILLSAIFLLCVMDNIQCKQKDQFPFEEKREKTFPLFFVSSFCKRTEKKVLCKIDGNVADT